MARSEYWRCPLRLPTPAAAHVAIASGVSQRVTSPRRTRARSYSAQFPTRYVVLYFGCTLDFTSRSCPAGGRDGQHAGHCSPTALNQRTNATARDCARLLLHGGSLTGRLAPRLRHRSYSTTSEEPPLHISTATGTSPRRSAFCGLRQMQSSHFQHQPSPVSATRCVRQLSRRNRQPSQIFGRWRRGFSLKQIHTLRCSNPDVETIV